MRPADDWCSQFGRRIYPDLRPLQRAYREVDRVNKTVDDMSGSGSGSQGTNFAQTPYRTLEPPASEEKYAFRDYLYRVAVAKQSAIAQIAVSVIKTHLERAAQAGATSYRVTSEDFNVIFADETYPLPAGDKDTVLGNAAVLMRVNYRVGVYHWANKYYDHAST